MYVPDKHQTDLDNLLGGYSLSNAPVFLKELSNTLE